MRHLKLLGVRTPARLTQSAGENGGGPVVVMTANHELDLQALAGFFSDHCVPGQSHALSLLSAAQVINDLPAGALIALRDALHGKALHASVAQLIETRFRNLV